MRQFLNPFLIHSFRVESLRINTSKNQTNILETLILFKDVFLGDEDAAQKHRDFYDEYYAILDMPAEFYLETLERVFMDQQLPKGTMRYRGHLGQKCHF